MTMGDWLLNLPVIFRCLRRHIFRGRCHSFRSGETGGQRSRQGFQRTFARDAPPLGIIFGLLVGFIAAQVWSDFEKEKVAVANEASALRTVNLLAEDLPAEQRARIRSLVTQHIDNAIHQEWP